MSRFPAWLTLTSQRLYVLLLVCGAFGALGYTLRVEGVFACPADGYGHGGGQYLAYCQTKRFGDYDHGALWFGLEPAAERAAHEAHVLFVGDSHMQFALSTPATSQWFASSPALFYLLGFSYGENARFVAPLLERLDPMASVYVINVDRFFDDERLTSAARAILLQPEDARSSHEDKRRWQAVHKAVCTTWRAICGNQIAFYRARGTGAWHIEGSEALQPGPVADAVPTPEDRAHWKRYAELGEQFVSRLPVDRRCVILTVTPSGATKTEEARAIAQALNLELVAPDVSGLRTFDGDHLDAASAQRWSAAFFEAAGPRIRQCLQEARLAAGFTHTF